MHGFNCVVARVGKRLILDAEAVVRTNKTPQSVLTRRFLFHFAHNELDLQSVDIARSLWINQSVGSRSDRQGGALREILNLP